MPTDKRVSSEKKLAKILTSNQSNYVSVAELRHNSADVVSRVAIAGERIVLTRNRKPVAAIVPIADFNSLKPKRR